MEMKTLFFDIGGVVLTNGWDFDSRKKAIKKFSLDERDFGRRHEMLRYAIDTGRIDLDTYLNKTIFYCARPFSRDDFKTFMYGESLPFEETIELVKKLRASGRYRMFALNNESKELNDYRVKTYGLAPLFDGFLTSCYLGHAKPEEEIYLMALGIAQTLPENSIFIDDRAVNIEAASAIGFRTILHENTAKTTAALSTQGIVI